MESRYPFSAFPVGWYALGLSSDLDTGALLSRRFMGQDLVLFRTESGEAAAVDAFCPHMGAHFAHGGSVEGEVLRCPMHHFCFDREGTCVSTGYGTKPPPKAKLRSWPFQEKNGLLLVYYDPDGEPPDWHVPELDMTGWTPWIADAFSVRSHPQETTENSVDLGHFSIVHGYSDVEMLTGLNTDGPHLNARYAMSRPVPFGMTGDRLRAEFEVHAHGLGYSFVEVFIASHELRTRHFVLPAPIDGDRIELRIALSLQEETVQPKRISPFLRVLPRKLASRLLAKLAFRGYAHDVQQDFKIWENKIYVHPPALAKGDGPVGQYRNWAGQFYRDESNRDSAPPS